MKVKQSVMQPVITLMKHVKHILVCETEESLKSFLTPPLHTLCRTGESVIKISTGMLSK